MAAASINSIETIRIADAEIRFYDEANDSIWDVPQAELVFQRMPYGFAVAANAEVSNGDEQGTWHADMSASYRRETRFILDQHAGERPRSRQHLG